MKEFIWGMTCIHVGKQSYDERGQEKLKNIDAWKLNDKEAIKTYEEDLNDKMKKELYDQ